MILKDKTIITIKGAGEMATGIAWTLCSAGFNRIVMTEIAAPRAIRRGVSFAEAIYAGSHSVEGIKGIHIHKLKDIRKCWKNKTIPILVDPDCKISKLLKPVRRGGADILIDATLSKKSIKTKKQDSTFVIGLGPGFVPNKNCHIAIETNRGHNLGRILKYEKPEADTGLPHPVCGYTTERVFRAPQNGVFIAKRKIGEHIRKNAILGSVGNRKIKSKINGVIRGILRNKIYVKKGEKLGDIDPRNKKEYCWTISDKARSIGGAVLIAILKNYPKKA